MARPSRQIHRLRGELYVLAETGEIYRSVNYGSTWTALAALTSSGMMALAEADGMLVAAAREGDVARSSNGAVWAWVGAVNQLNVTALGAGTPQDTGVSVEETAPRFVAGAPYPNPRVGSGGATFAFTLSQPDRVRIEVFDVANRHWPAREEEVFPAAGSCERGWVSTGHPAGSYLARFAARSRWKATAKWTLVR